MTKGLKDSNVISGVSWTDVTSFNDAQPHSKMPDIWEIYFFTAPVTYLLPDLNHFFTLDQYMFPSKNIHLESAAGMLRWTMFSCSFFEGQACKHTSCHQTVVASCAEVFISQWDKPPWRTPTLVLQDGVSFSLHSLAFSIAGKRYVEN